MPKRIQMSRQWPWRVDNPDAVIVDRRTKWGNRFAIGDSMMPPRFGQCPSVVITRPLAVALFRAHVEQFAAEFDDYTLNGDEHNLSELTGRDLACWCALDEPCHADVLLEIANR